MSEQAAVLMLLGALALTGSPAPAGEASGYWAQRAIPFQELRHERRLIFPSPNGRALVIIDGGDIWVRVDRVVKHLDRVVRVGWPAEIAWASDSSAFFITQSEDGIDGRWYVTAFLVGRRTVHVVDPAADVMARVRAREACSEAKPANTAAVTWLDGAKHLLVVAERQAPARCAERGAVTGYVVEMPTGRVTREVPAEALKREYDALLGPRLAGFTTAGRRAR